MSNLPVLSVFDGLTGNKVFILVGGLELQRVFKFKSSRFGKPSAFVRRSFKLISGYISVGNPGGKALIVSDSLLSNGFEFNSLMISESLAWPMVMGELILVGVFDSFVSKAADEAFDLGVEVRITGLLDTALEGPMIYFEHYSIEVF